MAPWSKLFSVGSKPKIEDTPKPEEPAVRDVLLDATGQDNEDWLRHLATRNPTHRKAGSTISEEYRMWLTARARAKAAEELRGNRQVA